MGGHGQQGVFTEIINDFHAQYDVTINEDGYAVLETRHSGTDSVGQILEEAFSGAIVNGSHGPGLGNLDAIPSYQEFGVQAQLQILSRQHNHLVQELANDTLTIPI